jgi:hypothetical protein
MLASPFCICNGNIMKITKIDEKNVYHLNDDQKKAAAAFMDFLLSDGKEFIISGAAGTGKTYLMSYIIDNTIGQYQEMCKIMGIEPEYDTVFMTATTNKAADVLSKSVNRPTSTIAKFMNLVVHDDTNEGVTKIRRTTNWAPRVKVIIFVDESSMIDTPLWKEIQNGTIDCKIIYVGDRYQMAPVQEDLSPIYKQNSPMVELLTPVRNAGEPALMQICEQLRETVRTGVFKPIKTSAPIINQLSKEEFQEGIDVCFKKQTHDVRILAYTNKRVQEYNEYIRFKRKLPKEFQVGELLVNNRVLHLGRRAGVMSVEMELEVIRNSGYGKLLVDEPSDTYLDINRIDVKDSFGIIHRGIPVPIDTKHYNSLLKYYKKNQLWKKYYELLNDIADFRQRDASTVYKAQGSTYNGVFIDLANIGSCNFPNQVARMLYVAFSRARSKVFLYGDLPSKYGGPTI